MTTIDRTGQPHLTLRETEPRQTPQPASRRFAETLGEGAHALLAGVEQAAGLLPGGSAVAAAVRGGASSSSASSAATATATTGTATTGTAESTGTVAPATNGSLQDMIGSSSSTAEELLKLQQQMAMEQRVFQTTSNVMKARHDTAKAVIQNVR